MSKNHFYTGINCGPDDVRVRYLETIDLDGLVAQAPFMASKRISFQTVGQAVRKMRDVFPVWMGTRMAHHWFSKHFDRIFDAPFNRKKWLKAKRRWRNRSRRGLPIHWQKGVRVPQAAGLRMNTLVIEEWEKMDKEMPPQA